MLRVPPIAVRERFASATSISTFLSVASSVTVILVEPAAIDLKGKSTPDFANVIPTPPVPALLAVLASPPPAPGGGAKVISALKKFVVPPPDAGTAPFNADVATSIKVV